MAKRRATFTLGGSDAAAACGVDPWKSPVMLYLEKTGVVVREESEAMRFGRKLEAVVWGELEERGYDLLPAPADGFTDSERPWLVGHPDGFVASLKRPSRSELPVAAGDSDPEPSAGGLRPGATAMGGRVPAPTSREGLLSDGGVLEIKTANTWAHRTWNGVPLQYEAQGQVYMHLTGRETCTLACLVGGQRLEVVDFRRDKRVVALLLEGMDEFHEHLRTRKMPQADGLPSTTEALNALYATGRPDGVVRLNREHWNLVRDLRAIHETQDRLKVQRAEKENRLKAFMGEAELAISPHDDDAIRWRTQTRKACDATALRKARPEVWEEFAETTIYRRFELV